MPQTVYTQAEVDALVAALPKPDLSQYYTKAQVDLAIAAAVVGQSLPPVTTTPAPTIPPVTTTPPPSIVARFYASSSPWNTKLPTTTKYTTVAALNAGGGWINYTEYSVPVVLAKSTDPLVTIAAPGTWGWPAQTLKLHVPVGQGGAGGSDGSITVIDGVTAYDFWQFVRTSDTTATVSAWAQSNIVSGTGWGTANLWQGAGIHATGSALLAGLIYGNELTTGINHALAVTLGRGLTGTGYVAPAIASDGEGGPIPEGARLAIPRTTAAPSSLTAQGKVLWTAFQEYGGFVIDKAPGTSTSIIVAADPLSVPAADVNVLARSDWTAPDITAIAAALKRVA